MSKDNRSRKPKTDSKEVFGLHRLGMSNVEIGKKLGITEATVRYHIKKITTQTAQQQKTDIVKALEVADLRAKLKGMCNDLLDDTSKLGTSKEALELRIGSINCVKGVVVALETKGTEAPTTSNFNETAIVADEIVASMTPEQLDMVTRNIDSRLAKSPQRNGGLIK